LRWRHCRGRLRRSLRQRSGRADGPGLSGLGRGLRCFSLRCRCCLGGSGLFGGGRGGARGASLRVRTREELLRRLAKLCDLRLKRCARVCVARGLDVGAARV